MPKENTHLYFADMILKSMSNSEIGNLLSQYSDFYYTGSIIPDSFFYGKNQLITSVSDTLHGTDDKPTNRIIFKILEEVREQRDLAFILGFISHCALDIVFHPVVYYLSGNYYDNDQQERDHSVYMHRHIETCLDRLIGNRMRVDKIIKAKFVEELVFQEIISIDFLIHPSDITGSLKKQLLYNRLFFSDYVYYCIRFLKRTGVLKDGTILGLFYGNIKAEGNSIDEDISYRDIISGEERVTSVTDLFKTAMDKARSMMNAAYGYYCSKITKEELVKIIPGENLNTGRLNVSINDIKYTISNS